MGSTHAVGGGARAGKGAAWVKEIGGKERAGTLGRQQADGGMGGKVVARVSGR